MGGHEGCNDSEPMGYHFIAGAFNASDLDLIGLVVVVQPITFWLVQRHSFERSG